MTNTFQCPANVQQQQLPPVLVATASPQSNNGSQIPYFHSLLCQWPYSLPLTSFWVLYITPNDASYLAEQLQKIGNLEIKGSSSNGSSWQISEGLNLVTDQQVSTVIGCAFASKYYAPGESMDIAWAGIQENNRGFMRGPIGGGRSNHEAFQIEFNETNSSIIENFIRPWSILAMHKGLFAYENSIKATINVLEYRKNGWDQDPVVRKRWTYFECIPYDVASYDASRVDQAAAEERKCSFCFNGYTVSDGSDT